MSASARDALTDYLYGTFNDPPHGWSENDCATEARDILAALSAAGFVVVPRDPTGDMVEAFSRVKPADYFPLRKWAEHTARAIAAAISAAEGKK